ncbi:hypothetical protein BZG35_16345 [Brevundimonas sp. LM2]|uniref:class I SAM-dependent methyltransferase n=1 Tax=Brevundimonas sp. LM2 TaxID=1938605 RepID=UPI000983D5E4|nr:class I SAM-dependent methyltransferase [Brevundimonas sp. LM2]AQR63052.1 hypothetical protein BZG35_16345 [Brevundimonas sp. LM2]
MDWTDGYYVGSEYTSGYYHRLGPDHLRFVCRAAGVHCRIPEAPTYLELGFGRGVSINLHAAAGEGEHWGVDFNPAHVAHAQDLADASGARVRLFDDAFARFAVRQDLPMFDVIVAHGVWSWISEANRQVLLQLIQDRLRPGGVAYVSYNAQPGWAGLDPVRHLMRLGSNRILSGNAGGGGEVDRALAFVEEVVAVNPLFFADIRPAVSHAAGLSKHSAQYLAHEYLNADWYVPYFADVAADMAKAKLTFVSSARLLDRVNDVNLTPAGVALLDRLKDPELRESIRDYLVNQRFRPDVYVKGAIRMSVAEQEAFWDSQTFVLDCVRDRIDFTVPGALGDASLPEEVYAPLADALAADGYKPKALPEILALANLPALKRMDAVSALTVLVGLDVLRPARNPGPDARLRSRAYNEHVLQRAVTGPYLKHLAAPVVGGGVPCARPDQVFLRAWWAGHRSADQLAAETWAIFQRTNERAVKNGQEMTTQADNLSVLAEMADRFLSSVVPMYRALGIVD